MSDFWANRLGRTQQPQAPAPAPQPTPTQPWWQVQRAPAAVPAQVPVLPVQQPQTASQQVSVDPNGQSELTALLRQDGYTTTKAQSAKDSDVCPACGSTNYMRAPGHPNSMKQCFECGSNERFEQMATGISTVQTQGPVRAARVQNPVVEGALPMGSLINK